jgi:hypothetical protein
MGDGCSEQHRGDEIGERGGGVAIYVGGEGITVPWARGGSVPCERSPSRSPPAQESNANAERKASRPAVETEERSSREGTSDGVDTETSGRLFRSAGSLVGGP